MQLGGIMKTQRNIFIAFILNLCFSVAELAGGFAIGSIAIISDALHDFGDAASIGISYFLEKKSKKAPDSLYTYGYGRYSVLGSAFTTGILLIGSCTVIMHSIQRIFHPTEIQYNGMIIFACVGVAVNLAAALVTRQGDSLNQKAVNLHMMEDVLGWVVVLLGAVIMRFTHLIWIDPLLSITVSLYILAHAIKNFWEILKLFLLKTPGNLSITELKSVLCSLDGVIDAHHIHIWSIDGQQHSASMHIRFQGDAHSIKIAVKNKLLEYGICHSVLELEHEDEACLQPQCHIQRIDVCGHHCHHHKI